MFIVLCFCIFSLCIALLLIFTTSIIPYLRKNYDSDLRKTFLMYVDDHKIISTIFFILLVICIFLILKLYIYHINPDEAHKTNPPIREQITNDREDSHTFDSQNDKLSQKVDSYQPTDRSTHDVTPSPVISNEAIISKPETSTPNNLFTTIPQGGIHDFSKPHDTNE